MNLFSKKNKNNTFNPKELNRKKLQEQNLIFFVIAIIIIMGLLSLVVYFINFIIGQMNYIFQSSEETKLNLEDFNLKGFDEIKDKIKLTGNELEKLFEGLNNTETTTNSSINKEISTSTTSTPSELSPETNKTSTLEINKIATSTPTITPSVTPSATPKISPSPTTSPTSSPTTTP